MFNVAANLDRPQIAQTGIKGYQAGQQTKASRQAYKVNEDRHKGYLYEFGKQKKVDKAREAYFTARDGSPEQEQATGMLMAHDPEFLQGMAEQQRKAQEAADKEAETNRQAYEEIAPVMMSHGLELQKMKPEDRVGYVQQNMASVLESVPKTLKKQLEQGLNEAIQDDGKLSDEELQGVLGAFKGFIKKDDPISHQFRTTQDGSIMAFNPQDPNASPIDTGQDARDPKGGQKLTVGPDGTITLASGAAAGEAVTPTKSTTTNLQKDLTNQNVLLSNLGALDKMYDPDFMTYASDAKAYASKVKEKFGGDLSAAEKDHVTRKTKFTTALNRMFNAYRKEITGAAAAVQEMRDLKNSLINEDMSATEFEAAYTSLREESMRSLRLKNKFLREGFAGDDLGQQLDNGYLSGTDDDPEAQLEYLMGQGLTEEVAVAKMLSEGYD